MPDVNEILATLVPALITAFAERGIAPTPTEWWCGRLSALAEETMADSRLRWTPEYEAHLTPAEKEVRSALSRIELALSGQQFEVAWTQLLLQLSEPSLDHSELTDRLRKASGGRIHLVDLRPAARGIPRAGARSVNDITLDTNFEYGSYVPSADQPEAPYLVLDELSHLLEVGARLLEIDSDAEAPGFRCQLSVRQTLELNWDLDFIEDMLWESGYQIGDLTERIDDLVEEFGE